MAGTTVSVSPWGATWPLLSLLCTIGALACVAELLEALTRRVERARWVVVPAASLPCFARWVVRFRLECNSVPCARNHSRSLSRKTASLNHLLVLCHYRRAHRRLFPLGNPIHDRSRASLESGRNSIHPRVVEGCRC